MWVPCRKLHEPFFAFFTTIICIAGCFAAVRRASEELTVVKEHRAAKKQKTRKDFYISPGFFLITAGPPTSGGPA
jgi:hypothetical protein